MKIVLFILSLISTLLWLTSAIMDIIIGIPIIIFILHMILVILWGTVTKMYRERI